MENKLAVRAGAGALALLMIFAGGAAGANEVDDTDGTGGIAGHLTDPHGDGVPFAEVEAIGDATWHDAITTTDVDGYFELTGLVPDDYRVIFSVEDRPQQYAFGQQDWGEADLIPVGAGEIVVVDDQLLPTGTLSGHFTDADGDGIADAGVHAMSEDGSSNFTPTDSEGHWSMEVFAGQYRVEFFADDLRQYAFSTTDWFAAAVFDVEPGDTITIDDQLLPHGLITGQLTDVHGDGVEFVEVIAEPDDGGDWMFGWTDADGFFSIAVLPGAYRVLFEADGVTQYAFGTTSWSEAEVFEVGAGETVVVNDTLMEVGAVTGRFTDAGGAGVPEVEVLVIPVFGGQELFTFTDDDGFYNTSAVPGDYVVWFQHWELGIDQYAFGATTRADAAVVSVFAGESTVVDDVRLPTGSVRVTAQDAITGASLLEFSASVGNMIGYTETGELIFTDVPVGTHQIEWAWAPGYSYQDTTVVTVVAGEQAEVTIVLNPRARIQTTVVDAATGDPLAGVCLIAATPTELRLPSWCEHVSDEDGKVMVEVDQGGTYQLLAWPRDAEGYGAQWVGRHGGTGAQHQAARLTVPEGGLAAAPVVHMDPAGTIVGTVTDPDGGPVSAGSVRIGNDGFNIGGGLGEAWIEADGSYTLEHLGPYDWPLLFEVAGQAMQWSGGAVNRVRADGVQVVAGGTVSYDYQLLVGTTVTVVLDAPPQAAFVVALNAQTGDRAATWWVEPGADIRAQQVLGAQRVKFQIFTGHEVIFVGGEDFASAQGFQILSHGEQSLQLS